MRYAERSLLLRDGVRCLLRSPIPADAGAMLAHRVRTSEETAFMARYGDEISQSLEQEETRLERLLADPCAGSVSAFVNGSLVADAGFGPVSPYERYRHRAECGISVQRAVWGLGIGSALLAAAIECTTAAGYHQLELEVVEENERAVALYQKFGFQVYGKRERSFHNRDGTYTAELLMLRSLR